MPARRKFLKARSTETFPYRLAELPTTPWRTPDKHFELHSASHAMLVAPRSQDTASASTRFSAKGHAWTSYSPSPPGSARTCGLASAARGVEPNRTRNAPKQPGEVRVHGFVSKPEFRRLNRNSIYIYRKPTSHPRSSWVQTRRLSQPSNILRPRYFRWCLVPGNAQRRSGRGTFASLEKTS